MRIFQRPDGRIYVIAEPSQDLLGDTVIVTRHGSVHSRRGGVHIYLGSQTSVEALARTRIRHGYREVTGTG
jgi:hypothetical protein